MKRSLLFLPLALFVGFAGYVLHEMVTIPIAEASGGGGSGSATCGTGTGNLVCSASPTLTGTVTASHMALSGGVAAVTGAFSSTVTSAGLSSTSTGAGVAVTATNAASGFALSVNGDTTSPIPAAMFMAPADANPSTSGAIGSINMFTGGYLRIQTGFSPAVWSDTGSYFSVTTGVTAHAGGGQASATAICTSGVHTVVGTVASANDSIVLPASPTVGQECPIKNKGANTLALFPGSGDALCVSGGACGAADASTTIAANAELRCWAESTSTWNCK